MSENCPACEQATPALAMSYLQVARKDRPRYLKNCSYAKSPPIVEASFVCFDQRCRHTWKARMPASALKEETPKETMSPDDKTIDSAPTDEDGAPILEPDAVDSTMHYDPKDHRELCRNGALQELYSIVTDGGSAWHDKAEAETAKKPND